MELQKESTDAFLIRKEDVARSVAVRQAENVWRSITTTEAVWFGAFYAGGVTST